MSNWYKHVAREANMWRLWVRYKEKYAGHVEIVWNKKVAPGFQFHFGNLSSETPLDAHMSFYWLAIFWDINFPGAGRFCEWIGRGHKRDISLKFHDGSMWWKLWYDDDMGYDTYHRCDSWRQPKLYPWRWGRKKHRAWMCLRDGNIDLNPLDAIWGRRYYQYEDLEFQDAMLHMNEFPGDQYVVHFKLQKQTRARRYGPKWVRHISDEGYTASWESKIPFRNNSWKGDDVLASAEKVSSRENWVDEALESLKSRIKKDRQRYNYRPREKS